MTPGCNGRPLDDMILGSDDVGLLDFEKERMSVTLVDYQTKEPVFVPVRPNSRQKAMYVFSRLPQEEVEQMIETIHDDQLFHGFLQIWQVTETQIRQAMATRGITVYHDLPANVARYVRETQTNRD